MLRPRNQPQIKTKKLVRNVHSSKENVRINDTPQYAPRDYQQIFKKNSLNLDLTANNTGQKPSQKRIQKDTANDQITDLFAEIIVENKITGKDNSPVFIPKIETMELCNYSPDISDICINTSLCGGYYFDNDLNAVRKPLYINSNLVLLQPNENRTDKTDADNMVLTKKEVVDKINKSIKEYLNEDIHKAIKSMYKEEISLLNSKIDSLQRELEYVKVMKN